MKALVFAYHNMGIVGLEALKRNGYEIIAVFTHEDDPMEVCWFGSVKEWAKKHHIEVFCPKQVNIPEWIEKVSSLAPDVIFSFYYRYLICLEILKAASSGAFNLHGSLLPAYRGRCPVNWVLINGEEKTGVTLHCMTEKPDAGDIVCQKSVPIEFKDTALTLYDKLYNTAKSLLDEALPLIKKGMVPRVSQNLSSGSYYGGRSPEDGRIDWKCPSIKIYNLIRAVTIPYPGAFSFTPDGGKLIIWWALPKSGTGRKNIVPGAVDVKNGHVFVQSGDGKIKLLDVECVGKRMQDQQIFEFFRNKKGIILS
jgi:UDP-4-amino-4-deoxy-L-arabinose formyltransferase/UDP-glucuronic acid dehydrogenase (UDP-4-keto-hexauronic acid decarboxylating)